MSEASTSPAPQRAFAWQSVIRPAIYWGGLAPGAWAFYLGFSDQLGADPIKSLEHILGLWALRFLIAALAVTPLRRLGGPNLLRYRRALGLVAFFYAALHLLVYVWLDQGLDLAAIGKDILKRPYITIGMLAFLILLPLAVTSNNAMIKRLGGAAWQQLHRWVYVAAALGALHFLMVVKSWPPQPLIYAGIVAALLLFRLTGIGKKARARARASMPTLAPDGAKR
ncbi:MULTISPECIES: protein-methionine-sulfoxide reductase heme-binding subunit MsrQ [Rhodomicrobium]|uniref:protein-methionine-sulfoxide reductase heme-binding subunit MsrQ n=1 Tax=Rhodomicrobium TaxID=1068 RepID=UPI000B4AFC4F|nr:MULTISPECIES: protein-methionine-sulfoxide reductase heme-binding subunit MsrQ [Rhodomicrobium]